MPRVLLLHTGGTLGMSGTPLVPSAYSDLLNTQMPELAQIAELESRILCNLDSSDIGPKHWTELAEAVAEERENYDGFVVIHGTDTMPYTASALAFSLDGLNCPVVFTGAQRPLSAYRTDARRNLPDAVELATCDIPEVGICFDGLLLRGCRAVKSNAQDYRAFDSPACPPLARLGVDITFSPHIRRPSRPFQCDARFDPRVMVLHITPGMTSDLLERLIPASEEGLLRGLVIVAFGAGTAPCMSSPQLAPTFQKLFDRGVDLLVVTQSAGSVDLSLYQNSKPLLDAGAIGAGLMGSEAALVKLMHALALYPDDRDARRRYLTWNVAGEM